MNRVLLATGMFATAMTLTTCPFSHSLMTRLSTMPTTWTSTITSSGKDTVILTLIVSPGSLEVVYPSLTIIVPRVELIVAEATRRLYYTHRIPLADIDETQVLPLDILSRSGHNGLLRTISHR